MKFNVLERVLHQQIDVIHSANSLCQEQRPSINLIRTDVISRGGTRKQAVEAYELGNVKYNYPSTHHKGVWSSGVIAQLILHLDTRWG